MESVTPSQRSFATILGIKEYPDVTRPGLLDSLLRIPHELVITDSIAATAAVQAAHNIRQLSIAPLMAEAIKRISAEASVSSLFD